MADLLQGPLAARGLPYRVLDSDRVSRDTDERLYEGVAVSAANWLLVGTFYRSSFLGPVGDLDDVGVVLLWSDPETCLERNRLREDPIAEAALHRIWREFERPAVDLVVDVPETAAEAVVSALLDRFEFDADRS